MRKIAALDWDGCLVKNAWPAKSYEWMPGAREAMTVLLAYDCSVFVFTSRISPMVFMNETLPKSPADVQEEINYIRGMLDDAGFTGVDIWTKPWKPYADAYVDDKAVHYAGRKTSWDNVTEKLLTMFGVED